VHTFARICELNLPHEEENFVWVSFGRALSRLAGSAALAIVSRLADRGRASLRWSLPPLLTALVADGHLPPMLAACLIGLDEPTETWSWRLGDFAAAVLPKLSSADAELVLATMLVEIDRTDLAAPSYETVDRLIAIAEPRLPASSPSLDRLRQLLLRRAARGHKVPLQYQVWHSPSQTHRWRRHNR
jgi:hypothetical protein